MIVDIHEQDGGYSLVPGVIAKGLPKGMTADVTAHTVGPGGLLDDSEGLAAAERLVNSLSAGKQIAVTGRICS